MNNDRVLEISCATGYYEVYYAAQYNTGNKRSDREEI